MGIISFLSGLITKKPEQDENKRSYVEDYENNRQYVDWFAPFRNDDLIDYADFIKANKKHPTVFRCINIVVDTAMREGWELVETEEGKGTEANKRLLLELFATVDPQQNYTFEDIMTTTGKDLLRDAMAFQEIGLKYPHLYRLDTRYMKPRLNKFGFFRDDDLGAWEQIIDGSTTTTFENSDLVWYRLRNTTELIYPLSPLETLLLSVETDLFGREFNYNQFVNNSVTGKTFVLPDNASQTYAQEIKTWLEENYVSSKDSFGKMNNRMYKPLIIYGGTKIDNSMVDIFKDSAHFIQLRQVTKQDIAETFGVPLVILGQDPKGLGSGGVSAEALNRFYEDTVHPFQALFENQFTQQYIRQRLNIYDWKLKFIRPKAINITAVTDNRIKLVNSGISSKIEARTALRPHYPELLEENDEMFSEKGAKDGLENVKQMFDAYGVGVRAGTITPQTEDEKTFRELAGLPQMQPDTLQAWVDDGGVRRPITLKPQDVYEDLNEIETEGANSDEKQICNHDDIISKAEGQPKAKLSKKEQKAILKMMKESEAKTDIQMKKTLIMMQKDAVERLIPMFEKKQYKKIRNFSLKHKSVFNDFWEKESVKLFKNGKKIGKATAKKTFEDEQEVMEWLKNDAVLGSNKFFTEIDEKLKLTASSTIGRETNAQNLVTQIEEIFQTKLNTSQNTTNTMITNFYNQGITSESKKLGDFVQYYQFLAIDDDRTTPRCEQLNEKIFKPSDLPLIQPPLHYNCRSMIIPITQLDIEDDPKFANYTSTGKTQGIINNTGGFDTI